MLSHPAVTEQQQLDSYLKHNANTLVVVGGWLARDSVTKKALHTLVQGAPSPQVKNATEIEKSAVTYEPGVRVHFVQTRC